MTDGNQHFHTIYIAVLFYQAPSPSTEEGHTEKSIFNISKKKKKKAQFNWISKVNS